MPEKRSPKLDHVVALEVPVSVVLAEKAFPVDQILELRAGAVLSFERNPEAPLDLWLNGSRVGRGRAVDIGERLGFLVESLDPR